MKVQSQPVLECVSSYTESNLRTFYAKSSINKLLNEEVDHEEFEYENPTPQSLELIKGLQDCVAWCNDIDNADIDDIDLEQTNYKYFPCSVPQPNKK